MHTGLVRSCTSSSSLLHIFLSFSSRSAFIAEFLIQDITIIIVLGIFVLLYKLPQYYFSKRRSRNKSNVEAHRHFVVDTQLLAKSRFSKNLFAAKLTRDEADKSIALDLVGYFCVSHRHNANTSSLNYKRIDLWGGGKIVWVRLW